MDDASACIGLGAACRALGDVAGGLAAADRALAHDPRDFRALILKADLLGDSWDARAVLSFYLEATQAAAPIEESLPPELKNELARARANCDRFAARTEEFLRGRMASAGLVEGPSTARFRQSIGVLFA